MEETKETKHMLGVILAEIYELKNQIARLQKEEVPHEQFTIDGLKCIYEHIVDREFGLDNNGFVLTTKRYEEIGKVLNDYETNNKEAVNNLDGFYGFPLEIQKNFSRIEWLYAFRAIKAERRFHNIISRIEGSQNSPTEFCDFS